MKLLILDLETTGLNRFTDCILEIAVCTMDLATGHGEKVIDTLVQPVGVAKWRDCWFMQKAGLFPADFATAPAFEVIAPQLQDLMDEMPATSYNVDFDFAMLSRSGVNRKKLWPCLMKVCTPVCAIPGKYSGFKFPSLDEAYERFFPGAPPELTHRAGPDCIRAARIAYTLGKLGAWVGEL